MASLGMGRTSSTGWREARLDWGEAVAVLMTGLSVWSCVARLREEEGGAGMECCVARAMRGVRCGLAAAGGRTAGTTIEWCCRAEESAEAGHGEPGVAGV